MDSSILSLQNHQLIHLTISWFFIDGNGKGECKNFDWDDVGLGKTMKPINNFGIVQRGVHQKGCSF
jgi:hypothetical protein